MAIIAPGPSARVRAARLLLVRQQRVDPDSLGVLPEPVPRGALPPARRWRHEARGGHGEPAAAADGAAGPGKEAPTGRGKRGSPLHDGISDTPTSRGFQPLPDSGARRAECRSRRLAVQSDTPTRDGPTFR